MDTIENATDELKTITVQILTDRYAILLMIENELRLHHRGEIIIKFDGSKVQSIETRRAGIRPECILQELANAKSRHSA